jgi:hypothetical protein
MHAYRGGNDSESEPAEGVAELRFIESAVKLDYQRVRLQWSWAISCCLSHLKFLSDDDNTKKFRCNRIGQG